jgi:hypothetical protein
MPDLIVHRYPCYIFQKQDELIIRIAFPDFGNNSSTVILEGSDNCDYVELATTVLTAHINTYNSENHKLPTPTNIYGAINRIMIERRDLKNGMIWDEIKDNYILNEDVVDDLISVQMITIVSENSEHG